MDVELVIARCGTEPELFGDVDDLTEIDRRTLSDETTGLASFRRSLSGSRVAIGRREGRRCSWWIVPSSSPLKPAATLWMHPTLFRPDGGGRPPRIFQMEPLWERFMDDARIWADLVGATVEALRRPGVVAVVLDQPHEVTSAFALVVLAVMGDQRMTTAGTGLPLAVSVGDPSAPADLHVGPDADGAVELRLGAAPTGDPVGVHIAQQLRLDASVFTGEAIDAEAAIEQLRAPVVTGRDEDSGERLANAIRFGGTAEDFGDALIQHAVQSGDDAPWVVLRGRPASIREAVMVALLARAGEFQPDLDLVSEFAAIYPKGAKLGPWCEALLVWIRNAEDPFSLLTVLRSALVNWPQAVGGGNRASLWTEAIRILVDRGDVGLAQSALTGELAHEMIKDGSGAALAAMWGSLPQDQRNPRKVAVLAEWFAAEGDGDAAVASLFRHAAHSTAEAEILIRTWMTARGAIATEGEDQLRLAVWDGEYRLAWFEAAVAAHGLHSVLPVLSGSPPEDPAWIELEDAVDGERPVLERIRGMMALRSGATALEPLARGMLADALDAAVFPDPGLAEIARMFGELEGTGALWDWLAVAAAHPERFPDARIDGAVVDLCEDPPTGRDRQLSVQVAERLALADDWTPLDHARWIVRFALAPDGDQTGFHTEVVEVLVRALCSRQDRESHLGHLLLEMLQLEPTHPAVLGLFQRWLPAVMTPPPGPVMRKLVDGSIPPALAGAWSKIIADR